MDNTPRNRVEHRHIAHRLLRARDWQDRPQFERLCEWWRGGFGGGCALVGIGGAGKTAIADRFIRSLPGVLPTPNIATISTLTPPRDLFVFSFYDAPNADAFFAELMAWLDDSEDAKVSYERIVRRLEKQTDVLLVLDGFEKVQDTGRRSGYFGRILDGRLRDLVLRSAEGLLPGVRLLITSRFQLFDALAERCSHFWQIPIEELTAEASVALLRQRGVRGSSHQLKALARGQGFHALSVDLLGGYIDRFLDSDPARMAPDVEVLDTSLGIDPWTAALQKQERRFARLAERYVEALRESDPAALALLQRVCLFRLGVDAATLASIFTGKGKDEVAGPELARLDKPGLEARLALLVEMKLLERDEDGRFSVHPAVRDGFLKDLDEETSRRGHEAARRGLMTSLGGLPGAVSNPSDLGTLDLLEEIIHHTLAAGRIKEAWDVYENRVGNYENLGWRLGAYERGERICRAFVGGQLPEEAPLPAGLSETQQAIFVNEWALYLSELGHLFAAACCYERNIDMRTRQRRWNDACHGNLNLIYVLLSAGRLAAAAEAAAEALRLVELFSVAADPFYVYAYRAHIRAVRGETPNALSDFSVALRPQRKVEKDPEPLLWSLPGIWYTLLLARLGQNEEAKLLAEANIETLKRVIGTSSNIPKCNLALADLARERQDLDEAHQLLDAAHEWAIARDAKEPMCWAALVRARLEQSPEEAHRAIEDGLRIARDCGYGIYHIDLMLQRARLALDQGDADAALTDINTAVFDGIRPSKESGLPELLAATNPECGYAWGETEGRHLRGEALLIQAARRLGHRDFVPTRFDSLPEDVRTLIQEARQELDKCRLLRKKIQDPKMAETKNVLKQIGGGILTRHPLAPVTSEEAITSEEKVISERKVKTVAKKHVFLSYVHESATEVEKLRDDLTKNGENVWWDRDIPLGAKWKLEIHKALKDAYAFVLCLSKDMEKRDVSGAFPEIRDAISIYRELAPGGIFIIPVRLSKCEVPSFEIDSTTMLGDLQFVDLFPAAKRPDALSRLVEALKVCPDHP